MSANYALIMAGGVGTRLWPMSRQAFPKQFHDVLGVGKSLLQLTFDRLKETCPASQIYIITNAVYNDLVKEQLPEITNDQLLLEPALRNTAPCIAYAAHKIATRDAKARLIVAPADHLIINQPEFNRIVEAAFETVSKQDLIVTFGIRPSRPDTGYGYIEYEQSKVAHTYNNTPVHKVDAFKEKPNQETAEYFLKQGNFLWNSGIFVWNVKTILESFASYLPGVNQLFADSRDDYYTSREEEKIKQIYANCINISVDYGILEKAENVFVIPADFGWSDLGTWKSIYEQQEKGKSGNIVQGEVLLEDTRNSFIRMPEGKLAVIQGLDNYMVIENENVLLICSKDQEQMVKQFLNRAKEEGHNRFT